MHDRRYELPYSWCCREGQPLASSDTVHPPKSRPTKKRRGSTLPQRFLFAADVAGFFIAALRPSGFEGSPPLYDLFANRFAASVALAPTSIDGCRSPKRYESLDAKTWSFVWRPEIRATESMELTPLISARNLVMPGSGNAYQVRIAASSSSAISMTSLTNSWALANSSRTAANSSR